MGSSSVLKALQEMQLVKFGGKQESQLLMFSAFIQILSNMTSKYFVRMQEIDSETTPRNIFH